MGYAVEEAYAIPIIRAAGIPLLSRYHNYLINKPHKILAVSNLKQFANFKHLINSLLFWDRKDCFKNQTITMILTYDFN